MYEPTKLREMLKRVLNENVLYVYAVRYCTNIAGAPLLGIIVFGLNSLWILTRNFDSILCENRHIFIKAAYRNLSVKLHSEKPKEDKSIYGNEWLVILNNADVKEEIYIQFKERAELGKLISIFQAKNDIFSFTEKQEIMFEDLQIPKKKLRASNIIEKQVGTYEVNKYYFSIDPNLHVDIYARRANAYKQEDQTMGFNYEIEIEEFKNIGGDSSNNIEFSAYSHKKGLEIIRKERIWLQKNESMAKEMQDNKIDSAFVINDLVFIHELEEFQKMGNSNMDIARWIGNYECFQDKGIDEFGPINQIISIITLRRLLIPPFADKYQDICISKITKVRPTQGDQTTKECLSAKLSRLTTSSIAINDKTIKKEEPVSYEVKEIITNDKESISNIVNTIFMPYADNFYFLEAIYLQANSMLLTREQIVFAFSLDKLKHFKKGEIFSQIKMILKMLSCILPVESLNRLYSQYTETMPYLTSSIKEDSSNKMTDYIKQLESQGSAISKIEKQQIIYNEKVSYFFSVMINEVLPCKDCQLYHFTKYCNDANKNDVERLVNYLLYAKKEEYQYKINTIVSSIHNILKSNYSYNPIILATIIESGYLKVTLAAEHSKYYHLEAYEFFLRTACCEVKKSVLKEITNIDSKELDEEGKVEYSTRLIPQLIELATNDNIIIAKLSLDAIGKLALLDTFLDFLFTISNLSKLLNALKVNYNPIIQAIINLFKEILSHDRFCYKLKENDYTTLCNSIINSLIQLFTCNEFYDFYYDYGIYESALDCFVYICTKNQALIENVVDNLALLGKDIKQTTAKKFLRNAFLHCENISIYYEPPKDIVQKLVNFLYAINTASVNARTLLGRIVVKEIIILMFKGCRLKQNITESEKTDNDEETKEIGNTTQIPEKLEDDNKNNYGIVIRSMKELNDDGLEIYLYLFKLLASYFSPKETESDIQYSKRYKQIITKLRKNYDKFKVITSRFQPIKSKKVSKARKLTMLKIIGIIELILKTLTSHPA